MRLAIDRHWAAAHRDPTVLTGGLKLHDIEIASEHLQGTYVIRNFAEFEAALRLFWRTARGTDPPGRTRDLIDGVAATRRVPNGAHTNAHAVREYRNALVHVREEEVDPIPIAAARGHVCRFFAFLPPTW
ncbi:MAG TPA: hypothetical protein VFF52_16385 [Isosphaeraceae bacterium]|nr:hypothetical protein [Isosphaeraceae bacterium]